jgi:hypothetical protein
MSKNMRKQSPPQKSISELKKNLEKEIKQNISLSPLKDEHNYHEWRRVELNSRHQIPRYR